MTGLLNDDGLYPRKGTIAVGSDADIVLRDPDETRTIRDEDMFSGAGFSVYSGWEVTGWPVITAGLIPLAQRDSIGTYSRRGCPRNTWRGRAIRCSRSTTISSHCASQPTVRGIAKSTGKSSTGKPMAW